MTIIQGTILTNQTREAQDIAVDEQGRVYVVIAGNLAGGGGEEAMWGGITGNIADQIDLGLVLEEKADHAGAETITGAWTFNPAAPGAPFTIGANGANQLVVTLNADLLDGEHGAYYLDLANSTGTIDTTQISDFTTEVNNLITAGGTGVVTGNTIYQGDITYEGNVSFTNVTNQPTFAAGLVSEGQITINTDTVEPPIILGVNQQGQVVVGLNADQIDGLDSTYLLDLSNSTGSLTTAQISDFTTAVDARITATGTGVLIGDSPIWTGSHTWQLPLNLSPDSPTAPFILNANAQGQLVSGLNADLLDGEHGTYYLDLANSTGQIDSTQISDLTTITGVKPDDNVTWTGTHRFENTPITITSTAAQPPFLIQGNAANRLVVDLNSDRLDNQEGAYYLDLANSTGNFNRQIQYATAAQQPPFTLGVNQQKQLVDGLNADQLDGYELNDLLTLMGLFTGDADFSQHTKPTVTTNNPVVWDYTTPSGAVVARYAKPLNANFWVESKLHSYSKHISRLEVSSSSGNINAQNLNVGAFWPNAKFPGSAAGFVVTDANLVGLFTGTTGTASNQLKIYGYQGTGLFNSVEDIYQPLVATPTGGAHWRHSTGGTVGVIPGVSPHLLPGATDYVLLQASPVSNTGDMALIEYSCEIEYFVTIAL